MVRIDPSYRNPKGCHERMRPEAQWIGLIMWDFRWNHGFDPANMMVSCQCSSNSGAEVVDFDESIQDGATLILYRQRRGSRWCLVGISRNAARNYAGFCSIQPRDADFQKSRRHPMANVLVTILIFNAYPGFSLHGSTGSCNRGFCSIILIHVYFACIKFVSVIVCWLSFHFRYSQISSLQPLQGGAPKIAKMVNITPISQWFLLVIHRTSFHGVNLNQ
jgi:hypothetical protein